jgi:uncharacterized membrane protein YhaH (DUF805 family)
VDFRLRRLPFALLLAGLVLIVIGFNVGVHVYGLPLQSFARFWWAPFLILVGITAFRLRDVGWSMWWALAGIIPFVGLILGIYLCARPSARPEPGARR